MEEQDKLSRIVQGKLRVVGVTDPTLDGEGNLTAAKLTLAALYSQDVPEDRNFSKYTPSAKLEMYVTNPVVLDEMQQVGREFYVYLVPADMSGAGDGFVIPQEVTADTPAV